ncbi:hypothetical protein ARMGADRAFT_896397, partial [Armillaria gallica]
QRAAAICIVNEIGNLGSPRMRPVCSQRGPEYHQSMAILLAVLVFSMVLSVSIRQSLVRENQ